MATAANTKVALGGKGKGKTASARRSEDVEQANLHLFRSVQILAIAFVDVNTLCTVVLGVLIDSAGGCGRFGVVLFVDLFSRITHEHAFELLVAQ